MGRLVHKIIHYSAEEIQAMGSGGGPHATNHENYGIDEVNVAGLGGELADPQPPKTHGHALGEVTGHNKSAHDLLDIDAATLEGSTVVQIQAHAPAAHAHPESDVTNLVTDLAAKETPSGAQAKVDAHKDLSAGVHGVGAGTIAKVGDIAVDANLSANAQNAITNRHAKNADTDLDMTFEATFEKIANKGSVSGYAALDANQKVPTVNLGGAGADNTKYLRGDQPWQVPAGGSTPPSYLQEALIECYPYGGAPTPLTPTTHLATVARIFPFEIDRPITVNRIIIRTNAALANCLILGIFNSAGTQLWTSGALSTLATRWVAVSANLPITLPVGTYYFATTNNNVASTTAAYTVTPALGGADLPRWGTVPATNGAMPASIDPAAITETVGGWMCYVLLSNAAT